MIVLPGVWEDAIRQEGERAYPNECCGILLGRIRDDGKSAEGIIPIHNAREAEEQYHRFRIDSEDLMRAEMEARKQNRDVLGFYHSHPDHPARPSDYDKDHALPFYSYIIVAVERGKAAELTSWELTPNRAQFLEEKVCFGTREGEICQ
ncbi:MAG: M67 family metallopeptidase [Treponema sp.]|jgi:proteasome lid subunit RPN8/RPN11|nr:M67 family metallopeptidase [Treponema sp.]